MISIRHAKPEEADVLSQIAISAKRHWGYPERWMKLWIPQLTFTPDYFAENESWVAEENGSPIGFYTLQERDRNAWIENMWLLPEFIGKGIGRQIFVHALELARQRGFTRLRLEADPNATGFYEKIGMWKVGEYQYELGGEPRVLPLMEIEL